MRKNMMKVMAVVLCCSLWTMEVPQTGQAATLTTFAALDYGFTSASTDIEPSTDTKDYTLHKTKYGSKSEGYSFTKGTGKLYASLDGSSKRKLEWTDEVYTCSAEGKAEREPAMTAGQKNPWKAGTVPYFEIQTSTSGYESVNFSAYVGASKKGPKYYRVSYAVGSATTFTKISGSEISLSKNKVMSKISVNLPSAAADKSLVKIRVEAYSQTTVDAANKNLMNDPYGGETSINHIAFQGEKKSSDKVEDNKNNNTSTGGSSSNTGNTSGSSSNTTGGTKGSTSSMKVSGIACSQSKILLSKGAKKKLSVSVKVSPKTSANVKQVKKKLIYNSSNKKVATVSKKGVVKAKKRGNAKVTIRYSSTIKCTVKVRVK